MAEHVYADPKRTNPVQQAADHSDKEVMPHHSPASSLSDLQRVIGNQGLQRLLAQRKIQAKLTVGAADDPYEREADRVAQEVMSASPETESVQRESEGGEMEEEELQMKRADIQRESEGGELEEEELQMKRADIQRESEGGELEEEELQMKRADIQRDNVDMSGSFEVNDQVENQINSMKGGGQALPGETQDFFETRFGQDFGDVRVHASSDADTLNRSVGARAFTNGSDIFMRSNEYSPDSSQGRELLAHELTHVVQQTGGKPVQTKREDE